jgi:hypothetical protein
MAEFEDGIADDLLNRATRAADELAENIRDDLQEAIDVSVEYGGGRIIRSKPGEPPRRETGNYHDSIQSDVKRDATKVAFTVFTDAQLGEWLEEGTNRGLAPRPHFAPCFERNQPKIIARVEDSIDHK